MIMGEMKMVGVSEFIDPPELLLTFLFLGGD